jgi:hypothetical protein
MPAVNNIKLTIGGPEATPGGAEARTHVIPVRGVPALDKKAERGLDPAIIGTNMDAGEYLLADSVAGGIPLAFRSVAGIGKLLKSLLGTEATPVQVAAEIRIRYKGSSASCKLVSDTTANTLKSYIGALGAEALDTNFGTAGSIDLTAVGNDTIGELVALIDGYADYECTKLFGNDSVSSGEIVTVAAVQGKNKWAYFLFAGAATGVYAHVFKSNLSNTERPTYSIQKDGFQDNFLFAGCAVSSLNLSAALKAMVEADCEILGFSEAGSQTASELILEDIDPLIFHKGSFSLGAKEYTFIRNHSLAIANNPNAEGYGQGTPSRQYHQKGKFAVTGDCQLRLDSDSFVERAKIFDGALAACSFYYKGKMLTGVIPELMLLELPFCSISSFEFTENNGIFDAKISLIALKPKGTLYDDPLTITMLTKDSGAY